MSKLHFFISQYVLLALFTISVQIFEVQEKKEKKEAFITFDLTDPDIKIPSNHDLKERKDKVWNTFTLPKTILTKEGYNFLGWTPDFIYGYKPDTAFYIQEENTVLKPLFVENNDKNIYKLEYYVVVDGELIDTSSLLPPQKLKKNSLTKVSALMFNSKKAYHLGFQYDGHPFVQNQFLVMPSKDVVLTPVWHNICNITYYAGDYEGVAGDGYERYQSREGSTRDLPEASRFSRKGYDLIGWHCEYDGKDYPPLFIYQVPDSNVDFYAIWEPHEYNVLFYPGTKEIENIRIKGKTGEKIIVPEIGERKGFTFKGWKDIDSEEIYFPGDEYLIKGLLPGLGVTLKAVWEENKE